MDEEEDDFDFKSRHTTWRTLRDQEHDPMDSGSQWDEDSRRSSVFIGGNGFTRQPRDRQSQFKSLRMSMASRRHRTSTLSRQQPSAAPPRMQSQYDDWAEEADAEEAEFQLRQRRITSAAPQRDPAATQELPADDLLALERPNDAIVRDALVKRFQLNEYYTVLQSATLVWLNPCVAIPIYDDPVVQLYAQSELDSLDFNQPPHIFEMAERAYRQLHSAQKNQTLLVSGLVGSGKTEAVKQITTYLAKRSQMTAGAFGNHGSTSQWERKFGAALAILEAFGSAYAGGGNLRSNRCATFWKLFFGDDGQVRSANMEVLPLFRDHFDSRGPAVGSEGKSGSTFLIFRYLLAGMSRSQQTQWMLPSASPADYCYLKSMRIDKDDRLTWLRLEQSIRDLLDHSDRLAVEHLGAVLAAILHLGNIDFQHSSYFAATKGKFDEASQMHLRSAAQLLKVDEAALAKALTTKSGRFFDSALPLEDSAEVRDKLAAHLYECLFLFLIASVNKQLEDPHFGHDATVPYLGLVELPGITGMAAPKNGDLQDLFGNTLEELARAWIASSLTREQEFYEEDGIMWEHVAIPERHQQAMELLIGSDLVRTLFGIETTAPAAVPKGILQHIHLELAKQDYRQASTLATQMDAVLDTVSKDRVRSSETLAFKHSMGNAAYGLSNLLRLTDALIPYEVTTAFQACQNEVFRKWFEVKSEFNTTSAERFLTTVGMWIGTLREDTLYAVHCILPNQNRIAGKLDPNFVQQQLQRSLLTSTIEVRKQSYAHHFSFVDFYHRYDMIQYTKESVRARIAKGKRSGSSKKQKHQTMTDLQPKCVDILQYAFQQIPQDDMTTLEKYQFGLVRIYLSYATFVILEFLLDEKRAFWATEIQRLWRGYSARTRLHSRGLMGQLAYRVGLQKSSSSSQLPKQSSDASLLWEMEQDDTMSAQQASRQHSRKASERSGNNSNNNKADWLTLRSYVGDTMAAPSSAPEKSSVGEESLELMIWISFILETTLAIPSSYSGSSAPHVQHLMKLLQDGKLLIQLCSRLFPDFPSAQELLSDSVPAEARVQTVRACLINFADMDERVVFETEDVIEHRNPLKVVECLVELKQIVHNRDKEERDSHVKASAMHRANDVSSPIEEVHSREVDDMVNRFRQTFAPVDVSNLNALRSKQKDAVQILLASEDEYIQALETILRFRTYLIDRRVMISKEEMGILFLCVDQIYDLHRVNLVHELRTYPEDEAHVGAVLYERLPDIEALYEYYAEYLGDTLSFVNAKKIGGSLKLHLEMFASESKYGAGTSLEDFLVKPFHRPMEILQLLKELDTVTPSSDEDKSNLERCIIAMKALVNKMNGFREQVFSNLTVSRTPQTASGPNTSAAASGNSSIRILNDLHRLRTQFRNFICKGSVWEVVNMQLVKERTLFLFSDCLLIAKEEENEHGEPTGRNVIRTIVDLSKMDLILERGQDPMDVMLKTPRVTKAKMKFARNPKDGIAYLIDRKLISATPSSVAEFLYRCTELNKRQLGRFLGTADNREILVAYLRQFNFARMRIDEAMRLFLASFRLPGETKAIDSILDVFATAYYKSNRSTMASPELSLRLAYALLLLNAELYRKDRDEEQRSMTLSKFVSSFRSYDKESRISDDMLITMYDSIAVEKLGIASSSEEENGEKHPITISNLPFRISAGLKSEPITVIVPATDSQFRLKIFASGGLRCIPSELRFDSSNGASFRLLGTTYGKGCISFLKAGPNAHQYSTESLPQGRTVVTEPQFMDHVFQLKSTVRDPSTQKRLTYMFSVANETQRESWSQQILRVMEAFKRGEMVDGLNLMEEHGEQVLNSFVTMNGGALVVPHGAQLDLAEDRF